MASAALLLAFTQGTYFAALGLGFVRQCEFYKRGNQRYPIADLEVYEALSLTFGNFALVRYNAAMTQSKHDIDDEKREQLQKRFNVRISQICLFVAFCVCVFSLATIVLGIKDVFTAIVCLTLAVILVIIAVLEEMSTKR